MKRRSFLWLALPGALLTPWIGPHVDQYLPLGLVLVRAPREHPDAGFWLIAGALFVVGYALSFSVLVAGAAVRRRAARDRRPT